MKSFVKSTVIALGLMTPALAMAASEEHGDWMMYAEDGLCWAVSMPTTWKAERGGQTVDASRGEIRLMVTFRPSDNVKGEVSYNVGYPLRQDSEVTATIGSTDVKLYTDGEWAWPYSPSEDTKLVSALKRGSSASFIGTSSRGTQTTDTISLNGSMAAINAAEEACY
ncbi:hypothetical protein ACMA5I_01110 [Paracoccaceae bacterium GXU_MW_L88]